MRAPRVQIRPDEQRVRLPSLAQDIHDHRDVANRSVRVLRRSPEQNFHIHVMLYQTLAHGAYPVHAKIAFRTGGNGGSGSLDVRDAQATAAARVRHVPALDEYGSRAERTELPRSAHHILDRGYLFYRPRRIICSFCLPDGASGLTLAEEQRFCLCRVWREHRREREELLYEHVERLVL